MNYVPNQSTAGITLIRNAYHMWDRQ